MPAALIATAPFEEVCRATARIGGLDAIRWVTVAHPLGSLREPALRERAASAARQFEAIVRGV